MLQTIAPKLCIEAPSILNQILKGKWNLSPLDHSVGRLIMLASNPTHPPPITNKVVTPKFASEEDSARIEPYASRVRGNKEVDHDFHGH